MTISWRRWSVLAVFLVWATPALGAVSTVIHVALDHHESVRDVEHEAEHADRIAELLRAASHGHHHDLAAPEHDHEATRSAREALAKSPGSAVGAGAVWLGIERTDDSSRVGGETRRAPPDPLTVASTPLLL